MKQTFPLIILFWVFFSVTHDSARAGTLQNQTPEDTVSFTPEDRFRFIEVKGHSGAHLYSDGPLEDALKNGYGALELRYGWQSHNPEGWQSMYRYPAYGVGWYSGFIGNPEQMGMPGGVYGFISFPLQRHKKHVFITETALGLSYDLKPYNPDDNVYNDLIGSRISDMLTTHPTLRSSSMQDPDWENITLWRRSGKGGFWYMEQVVSSSTK